jgi:hypothetical protein
MRVHRKPQTFALFLSGTRHRTLHDVLMLVLEALFRRDGRPDHVLAFGYRLTSDGPVDGAPIVGHPTITCTHPNPIVMFLKRKPWDTLHSRLGDAAFIHLLLHTAIYVEVSPTSAAGNYVQVRGHPTHRCVTSM